MAFSDILGIAGLLVGVVGVILAIAYARQGRRTSALSTTSDSQLVIRPSVTPDEQLKITWGDRDVPQVTRTNIAIWNSGTEVIHGTSVVDDDPVRVVLGGDAQLLRASVVKRSRDSNRAELMVLSERAVLMRFDYLDPGDGLVVEVLHTGEPFELHTEGTIKGIRAGIKELDRGRSDRLLMTGLRYVIAPFALLQLLVLLVQGGLAVYQEPWPKNLYFGLGGLCFILFVVGSVVRSEYRDRKPRPYRIGGVPELLAEGLGEAKGSRSDQALI